MRLEPVISHSPLYPLFHSELSTFALLDHHSKTVTDMEYPHSVSAIDVQDCELFLILM